MPPVRCIYISPHLDDAVLSCGGLIFDQSQAGIPVEVWTICAGDAPPGPLAPMALSCHEEWGTGSAEETLALRRREDRRALEIVGAAGRYFDTPDCIYRRLPGGEALYPDRFTGPRHPHETDLDAAIAGSLAAGLRPDDSLICPLGVGGHLDHVLVRQAAERLGRKLRYYVDIPYFFTTSQERLPAAEGMQAQLEPVSEAGLHAWLAGIRAYHSQIHALFGSEIYMEEKIRGYWADWQGVDLWQA